MRRLPLLALLPILGVCLGAAWHYLPLMLLGAAPSGYSITASPPSLNALNQGNAGFTLTGGQAGYTCSYAVTTSGGTQSLVGSFPVSGSPMTSPRFSVTSLAAGTLTYSASLSSSAGTGSAATCTATYSPTALGNYYSGQTPNDPFTHNSASGAVLVNNAYSAVGSGSLSVSQTAGLSLSGTNSYPCSQVVLCSSTTGALVGSSSASTTLPLPANTPLMLPVSNTNLLFLSGTATVGYLYLQ